VARLDKLLTHMKDTGASDLHLAAGREPRMRSGGTIKSIPGYERFTDESLRDMLVEIVALDKWQDYEKENDLDFAYGIPGVARFRANYFVQEYGAAAVFRTIPERILTLEELRLPAVITSFTELKEGLVLVTGPTGSGKSTTLAAMIDRINSTKSKHIITVEDPVEFVHTNKQSVLSHREVGRHTDGFGGSLRAALRQNPDVVLVGEMRDVETIGLAITAAEMGLLVFGTLHTNSAVKTVDRLVDAFPADEQEQIRLSLAESLAGVVSQLLLRSADGTGRRACHEILIRDSSLANIIREGKTNMLNNIIQNGKAQGMCTMDDSLMALVKAREISGDDAYMKASDKTRFESFVSD
jgi:twitching motility protein PilT